MAGGAALGKDFTRGRRYKEVLEELGFVDVVETRTQFPIGTWAVGKKMKTLGDWMKMDMLAGLLGMSMAIMTRGLGMTPEEVAVHLENVKTEIESNKLHAYFPVYVSPNCGGFQLLICGQSVGVWPQALGLEAAAVPYPTVSESNDQATYSPPPFSIVHIYKYNYSTVVLEITDWHNILPFSQRFVFDLSSHVVIS